MFNKAFTLVELIIVIAIIALLSTLGLSTYNAVQQEARNSIRKADLKEIKVALESYKIEHNNQYPSTCTDGSATCAYATTKWSGACDVNPFGPTTKDFVPGLAPTYIDVLPLDPRDNRVNTSSADTGCQNYTNNNCYLYKSTGIDYKILAHCTPEGTMKTDDAFFDPCRPTWAWQISSDPSVKGVLKADGTGCETGGW